ncbi:MULTISPECIES: tetratricopeptide repeat protein [Crocosphaera]|uniref:Uncharacterized protein n=2 Tax=Crocosphaera watsonii TaxID=263511 RepID=T2K032_CROWT|nr:tetratricopeptide repeat protein [Crocosphaera sp.]EHJ12108.1 hypothetical protein CWATWH0003_3173 [Crocosphaera watsonii WH 0003]NQZ62379.1 tetratricopeptide repeat protein [Crocosphaera sp.]CCQ70930.1 hypothetical protein CWATWH0402_3289 [Crocosphaera watsonii WH 0402]
MGFISSLFNVSNPHSFKSSISRKIGYRWLVNPPLTPPRRGTGGEQEFKKAIDDYNKVISLNPQDGLAYLNRGIAYSRLGENQKAIPDLQKAISLSLQQGDMLNAQRARQTLQQIQ